MHAVINSYKPLNSGYEGVLVVIIAGPLCLFPSGLVMTMVPF